MNTTYGNQGGRSYCLQLADGAVWQFTGGEEVSDWLDELSYILGLKTGHQEPTYVIHFHGVKDLSSTVPSTLPVSCSGENGWRSFKNAGIQRVWRHARLPEIHVELHEAFFDHKEIRYINMWSALRELHRHALAQGGTPMHATLAALQGKGVLIAAAGGTGKSTCYTRLPGYWDRLCDDQALILQVSEGKFRAHPFPTWSDHLWRGSRKQWHVERSVPLNAVFFLEQAPLDHVTLLDRPFPATLEYLEAAKQVCQPIWTKVEKSEKTALSALLFENVTRLARAVPAYRLRASLNGQFWKEIERVFF